MLGWRVPLFDGDGDRWVAGWLTEPGSAFRVHRPSRAGHGDGTRFGWVEVGEDENVVVRGTDSRGQRVDLLLSPEAAERGGAPGWALPGEEVR